MANTDLQYRRTERYLLEAFGTALNRRPLDKITVTSWRGGGHQQGDVLPALSGHRPCRGVRPPRRASARGRHEYLDEYFDDPRSFAAQLVADFDANKEEGLVFGRNGIMHSYLDAFASATHARLSEFKPVVDDKRGSMMTTFMLTGILNLLPRYKDDSQTVAEVAGDLLTAIHEYGRSRFE